MFGGGGDGVAARATERSAARFLLVARRARRGRGEGRAVRDEHPGGGGAGQGRLPEPPQRLRDGRRLELRPRCHRRRGALMVTGDGEAGDHGVISSSRSQVNAAFAREDRNFREFRCKVDVR